MTNSPLQLLLLAILLLAPAAALKTETHNFGLPFSQTTIDNKKFSYNDLETSIASGAIQITQDSGQNGFNLSNQSDRILFKKQFTLWKHDGRHNRTTIASFNTSFVFNIGQYLQYQPIGEGMAFIITPDDSYTPPAESDGQYLGLTNSTTDGNATNHLFAVEFDTRKQDFDPDDNHIGIDFNGIKSKKTASLSKSNITLAPINVTDPVYKKVWIHYDGRNQNLTIYIANLTNIHDTIPMPESPVLILEDLNLSAIVAHKSYFGFAASTGSTTLELNCVFGWNITVELIDGGGSLWWLWTAIAIAIAVVVTVAVCMWRRRRARKLDEENIAGALKSLPGMPREFGYRVLRKATGNFEEKNRLGEGGYGVVFKGVLPAPEEVEVAVKKFTREDAIKSKDDFMSELTIINRLRHKHLVKLLGWCHKNKMLLLVYEYMPNCSLDKHLFSEEQPPLSWQLRYKILGGVASALQYLHHEFDETVIHRDLKASNIMLDANFNARLGDFGLARALEQEKTSYAEIEGVHGTMGYIAPECLHTGKATRESDVYAFGAVLLEVATGNRPFAKLGGFNCLADWVWSLHRGKRIVEAVDSRLGKDYDVEEAERVLLLGLACLHPIGAERPKAQAIVQILSGSLPTPSVPPFKPSFMWPPMGPIGLDTSNSMNSTTDTTPIASSRYETEWTTSQSINRYVDHSTVHSLSCDSANSLVHI